MAATWPELSAAAVAEAVARDLRQERERLQHMIDHMLRPVGPRCSDPLPDEPVVVRIPHDKG